MQNSGERVLFPELIFFFDVGASEIKSRKSFLLLLIFHQSSEVPLIIYVCHIGGVS